MPLVDGALHRDGDRLTAGRDAHDDPAGAAHGGEELCAVEHEVRRPGQEDLVLVARRLAFHAVHHEGSALTVGSGRAQLCRRRKGAAPAAQQTRQLEARDEGLLPRAVDARRDGEWPVGVDVVHEVDRMAEKAVQGRPRGSLAQISAHSPLPSFLWSEPAG